MLLFRGGKPETWLYHGVDLLSRSLTLSSRWLDGLFVSYLTFREGLRISHLEGEVLSVLWGWMGKRIGSLSTHDAFGAWVVLFSWHSISVLTGAWYHLVGTTVFYFFPDLNSVDFFFSFFSFSLSSSSSSSAVLKTSPGEHTVTSPALSSLIWKQGLMKLLP